MHLDAAVYGELSNVRCNYGDSRLPFRGPRRTLEGDYVVFLGATDTFGKFLEQPFPMRVEAKLGMPCVNMGLVNGGVDAFEKDQVVMTTCQGARAVVIQVMGAQNLSNRFYTVHPRRNDRFLYASSVLQTLYPEVDFADYSFTRHMLSALLSICPKRFEIVVSEVQTAWSARMRRFVSDIDRPVVLLWFADHRAMDPGDRRLMTLDREPLFVDAAMLDTLRLSAKELVRVVPDEATLAAGPVGMTFNPAEAGIARELMNSKAHGFAADALLPALQKALNAKRPAIGGPLVGSEMDQSLSVSSGTA